MPGANDGGFGGGHATGQGLGAGGGGGGMGGAIFSMFGSLTVINSTLTANTAQGGGSVTYLVDPKTGIRNVLVGFSTGGSGFGGAIFNLDGTASITFSTLAANTVTAGTGSTNGSADGGALQPRLRQQLRHRRSRQRIGHDQRFDPRRHDRRR